MCFAPLTTFRQVPIQWEEVDVTPVLKGGKTVIPDAAVNSIKKNTVALKGEHIFWTLLYPCLTLNTKALWLRRVSFTRGLSAPWLIFRGSWKGSRFSQLDPPEDFQPFRQRSAMRFHSRIQDAIR